MIEFDPILVHEWLSRSAKRFPDKVAVVCGKRRLTYCQLEDETNLLAYALVEAGLKRHNMVVVFLDNSIEAVVSIFGILKAGGTFIIPSGSLKSAKLSQILENSMAHTLITSAIKAKVVSEALENLKNDLNVIWTEESSAVPPGCLKASFRWKDFLSGQVEKKRRLIPHPCLPDCIDVDLACLIYTSGSTGRPKGVMETHHNMISAAKSVIQYIGNEPDDVILNTLPLSFGYGLYQVIMAFMFGGTVILEKSFMFVHDILTRISQEKVTGFPIVPTIVAMMLKLQTINSYDFSSLRYLTNASAALPIEHIRKLRSLLPDVRIFSMYGLTECKRVSYLPPDEIDSRPCSVGKAIPNCETFVVDENGKEVEPGQTGELVVRGSNVMQGYWGQDDNSQNAYRKGLYPDDTRLYSGDLFRRDAEGFLYFVGRKDDMIKSKGERISPKEIEDIICRMENVSEAAVIGVPDDILGQAVKAFISPMPNSELTEKDVLKYCTENMESFMIPKYIQLIDSLPKTANGKINKKQLSCTGEQNR